MGVSNRRQGTRSLARAVLDVGMSDLRGCAGFSTCPASERPRWKRDARHFFTSGATGPGSFEWWTHLAELGWLDGGTIVARCEGMKA